jgi:hypothetical protein
VSIEEGEASFSNTVIFQNHQLAMEEEVPSGQAIIIRNHQVAMEEEDSSGKSIINSNQVAMEEDSSRQPQSIATTKWQCKGAEATFSYIIIIQTNQKETGAGGRGGGVRSLTHLFADSAMHQ